LAFSQSNESLFFRASFDIGLACSAYVSLTPTSFAFSYAIRHAETKHVDDRCMQASA
jgi:hypothetical protein